MSTNIDYFGRMLLGILVNNETLTHSHFTQRSQNWLNKTSLNFDYKNFGGFILTFLTLRHIPKKCNFCRFHLVEKGGTFGIPCIRILLKLFLTPALFQELCSFSTGQEFIDQSYWKNLDS